jgi:hypothetical protein
VDSFVLGLIKAIIIIIIIIINNYTVIINDCTVVVGVGGLVECAASLIT